ncbi:MULTISPECIES: hypothetical protein [unclassified Brevundimonas]|uniref:hypothetical protein n=1 Tax=unclassified Brevundimonas TaxID=2622653 RepID=UPI0025C23F3E|nr:MULTISPECIES: hypothetical protein [unclassified Brevundimonas]
MPHVSHLTGQAGSTYSPLPTVGTQTEYAQGPFAAELAPALSVRSTGAYPEHLYIGLLTSKPDPDGVGGVELSYPGYARQSVDLSPRSNTHFAIGRPVLFEIFGCPAVTSIALFDGAGAVVAHGTLRGRSTDVAPPSRFEFPSHQILVRKPNQR